MDTDRNMLFGVIAPQLDLYWLAQTSCFNGGPWIPVNAAREIAADSVLFL